MLFAGDSPIRPCSELIYANAIILKGPEAEARKENDWHATESPKSAINELRTWDHWVVP